jgi:hypothetical protein
MKKAGPNDKRNITILAVVCAALLLYLIWSYRGFFGATASSAPPSPIAAAPRSARASKGVWDDLATYDPLLALDMLQALQSRPAPELDRSPFDWGITPEQRQALAVQKEQEKLPRPPPPPPPPPPITLKALGYEDAGEGSRQAFIAECPNGAAACPEADQNMYTVRQGDSFANRYKVIKITPTAVEVEDESYHQTAQLAFPQ